MASLREFKLESDWSVSNIGHTASATYYGKRYFLKKYGEYKLPTPGDPSITPRLAEKMTKAFEDFEANRIAINRALERFAGIGGNVILPGIWFRDGINFFEATEFIDNVLSKEKVYALGDEERISVMITASAALHNIHKQNIIHSDLKPDNILVTKNSYGLVVAKIIDFDRSYFSNRVRASELAGTQNYMAPELVFCFESDMCEEGLALLSTKSDIFSLGIVFYNYLTRGKFPEITGLKGRMKEKQDSGQIIYPGEALLHEGTLVIGSEIREDYLRELIKKMISPMPADRPDAIEVLSALKNKKFGTASASVTPPPAPKPVETTPPPAKKTVEEFCTPWAEHGIVFDIPLMKSRGYVGAELDETGGNKCYKLYFADGTSRIFGRSNLCLTGLAKSGTAAPAKTEKPESAKPSPKPETETKASSPSCDGMLWDDDAKMYAFDSSVFAARGVSSIGRMEKGGVKGYLIKKIDGAEQFVGITQLKLFGYVKKL